MSSFIREKQKQKNVIITLLSPMNRANVIASPGQRERKQKMITTQKIIKTIKISINERMEGENGEKRRMDLKWLRC